MKSFEVTIWNTVNMSRDINQDNTQTEQHTFNVEAETETEAYQIAKTLHFEKTKKGVWEHDIIEN